MSAEIAIAPLPVLMWIQSQGTYPWTSRHSADALYACAREGLICTYVCGGVGLLIGVICGRGIAEKLGVAFMVSTVTYLVWTYLDVYAVAYA